VFQRQPDRLFCATRGLLVRKNARKLGRSRAFTRIWKHPHYYLRHTYN
jgi:hypothetical protein